MSDAPDTDPQDQPTHLGSLMYVVHTLLTYGKHIAETVVRRSKQPSFASFASIALGFGTADLSFILASLERGILRATALMRVLEARLATGRDIVPKSLSYRSPAPAAEARERSSTPRRKSLPWNDLSCPLTVEEMVVRIRRRPIGRTIVDRWQVVAVDWAFLR